MHTRGIPNLGAGTKCAMRDFNRESVQSTLCSELDLKHQLKYE